MTPPDFADIRQALEMAETAKDTSHMPPLARALYYEHSAVANGQIRRLLAQHDRDVQRWERIQKLLPATALAVLDIEGQADAQAEPQRCETCQHATMHRDFGEPVEVLSCDLTRHSDDYGADLMFTCATLGNFCGAWQAREGT